jgi:phospholipid/cholesterol/gamma-HCH transport system substrate-binding protein
VRVSKKTLSAGIKLAIFTAVSLVVTGTLVAIMGRFGSGETVEYSAIFKSASLLEKGDDVRVGGVVLGKVQEVEIHDTTAAKVTFSMAKDMPITDTSRVEIRYLNLVGDRYVSVVKGRSEGERLREGATIPADRTSPALNLTALYNGFAPLFSALEPNDINALSLNLIKVLQGEGGTVESLMAHTASLTSAVADRDKLVGDVITNLDELLTTVDSKHQELTLLIKELKRWMTGLAEDRVQIGRSVVNISELTRTLAGFISESRPVLKEDIVQLRRLADILARPDTDAVVKQILRDLPEMLEDQTRTGTYGSWYNYYLCGVAGNIKLPEEIEELDELGNLAYQLKDFAFHSTAKRCEL